MVRKAALIAAAIYASPALAQTTTACQQFGNRVDCHTTPDTSAQTNQAANNLGAAIGQMLVRKNKPGIETPQISGPVDIRTGNGFYATCSETPGKSASPAWWICSGYVAGYIGRDGALPDNATICLPEGVNNGQLMDVLLAFLRDHPQDRHRDIGILTLAAFSSAFPCQRAVNEQQK